MILAALPLIICLHAVDNHKVCLFAMDNVIVEDNIPGYLPGTVIRTMSGTVVVKDSLERVLELLDKHRK